MSIDGRTVLAVIPARGGSKRCLRKNIRPFRGKPLVVWAIEQAKASKCIDLLAVSSEDKEIQDLVRSTNTHVIERPSALATDDASSEDVLRHALTIFACDWVVLLQPTSPLRTTEDIDGCIARAQMGHGCYTYNMSTNTMNGAVYVAKSDWIMGNDFGWKPALMRYPMEDERSLDIDNEKDFLA